MPEPLSFLLMVGTLAISPPVARPQAVSREGEAVRTATAALHGRLWDTPSFKDHTQHACLEAWDLYCAHAHPGWDGEDALPLTQRTVYRVANFLRLLPHDLPMPELSAEPDGAVALEWLLSRHRMLSVSVLETGSLAYAWVNGSAQGHAVARFDETAIPQSILDTLRWIRA